MDRKVNASFQNATLNEVMSKILGNQQLTWIMQDKMIIISKKGKEKTSQRGKTINITGVINDEAGIPIIGASVLVRGSATGTITDMDGNFTISDVPLNAMIDISYIGYKTLSFKATDKALTNITMKEDTEVLEEVVVVGYGTTKKANLSGSVAQISSKEIEHRISSNTGSALQGLIPNLNVSFSDGAINKKASFNVRGEGSINGGEPLVLIDGVEGDMNYINPKDIASVTVLKRCFFSCYLWSSCCIWRCTCHYQKSRERESTSKLFKSFCLE